MLCPQLMEPKLRRIGTDPLPIKIRSTIAMNLQRKKLQKRTINHRSLPLGATVLEYTMDKFSLFKLSYGLYVLTTSDEEKPYGCIINTAFQITADPPRLAVSCNKDNFTYDKIVKSGTFGVTVLSEQCDPALIGLFGYKSGREVDKFANLSFSFGKETGVPLLHEQGMTTFECKVVERMDVGTHSVFIGEVLDGVVTKADEKEMTYRYYHEVLKGSAPKNAPTYMAEKGPAEPTKAGEIWVCSVCGYVYDSAVGTDEIPAGTLFENLPDDWSCPICSVSKEMFNKKE